MKVINLDINYYLQIFYYIKVCNIYRYNFLHNQFFHKH